MRGKASAGGAGRGFHGRAVVITRPAGTAGALARRVRALGGVPVLLPGMALRGMPDAGAAREALLAARDADIVLYTSPTAVRFAARLAPLDGPGLVLAVGQGTLRALRRHGARSADAPERQDSEGLLAHPALQAVEGRSVALVTAPGGRGVLARELAARGARVREIDVYQRVPARLGQRHFAAAANLPPSACVLLSSAEAVRNLAGQLPRPALAGLCAATAVVSSDRLAAAARDAGFRAFVRARSALSADLVEAALGGA